MATIDKALPNVKQTLTIPGPEEVQEEQQQNHELLLQSAT